MECVVTRRGHTDVIYTGHTDYRFSMNPFHTLLDRRDILHNIDVLQSRLDMSKGRAEVFRAEGLNGPKLFYNSVYMYMKSSIFEKILNFE